MYTTQETADKMRAVLDLIERNLPTAEKPKVEHGFDMGDWAEPASTSETCGTTMCFAGWNCIAGDCTVKTIRPHDGNPAWVGIQFFDSEAEEIDAKDFSNERFGIHGYEGEFLYFTGMWPEMFKLDYDHAGTMRERFNVLRRRVEHFIETGE